MNPVTSVPRKIQLDRNYQVNDQIKEYIKDVKNLNKINRTYNHIFENPQVLFREIELQSDIKLRQINRQYQDSLKKKSTTQQIELQPILGRTKTSFQKVRSTINSADQYYYERLVQREKLMFEQKPIQLGFKPSYHVKSALDKKQ